MSVDHYIFNDKRQILINNIKIHMNVRCAEMTSSEIANLTILVEVQNVKTFYEKNMKTTELNNSTNINKTKNNL
jgi:hypothetical protein